VWCPAVGAFGPSLFAFCRGGFTPPFPQHIPPPMLSFRAEQADASSSAFASANASACEGRNLSSPSESPLHLRETNPLVPPCSCHPEPCLPRAGALRDPGSTSTPPIPMRTSSRVGVAFRPSLFAFCRGGFTPPFPQHIPPPMLSFPSVADRWVEAACAA